MANMKRKFEQEIMKIGNTDEENYMDKIKVKFEQGAMLTHQTEGASGYDLHAYITNPITLYCSDIRLLPTGIYLEIPQGYEAQVRPRSGLALKYGITVLNTPGTIDADYRGEVKVLLVNLGYKPFTIEPEMRIAQLVFSKVYHPEIQVVSELEETERGSGGFNSTGLK